jgi:hypothetical protein
MKESADQDPMLAEQIRALDAEVTRWNEVLGRINPASPTAKQDYENARVARGLARLRLAELQLRARGEIGQTIDRYLDTDQENLDRLRVLLPEFRVLMPLIHELYDLSHQLIPPDDPSSMMFGRGLLMCHKSFLAAAAAIARCHPDDAAPLTRRAIEAAGVVVAIKHDPQNLERWRAAERRLARWDARLRRTRPPHLKGLGIKYPDHPVLDELRRYEGILSDAFVHFTPEFIAGQTWKHMDHGARILVELQFLEVDQRVLERELVVLGAIHHRILGLFDEYCNRAFSRDQRWCTTSEEIARQGAALGMLFRQATLPSEDERSQDNTQEDPPRLSSRSPRARRSGARSSSTAPACSSPGSSPGIRRPASSRVTRGRRDSRRGRRRRRRGGL